MAEKETLDVGSLVAEFRSVRLPMGLVLDRVVLGAQGVHVQRKPFLMELSEPGLLQAFVSEQSLGEFLDHKAPGGLKDFEVELRDEKILVRASLRIIVEVRATAVCRLVIEDGQRLLVDLESVDVMGVGAKNLLQSQLDGINPVLDLADLPIDGELSSVRIHEGEIMIEGTVAPRM